MDRSISVRPPGGVLRIRQNIRDAHWREDLQANAIRRYRSPDVLPEPVSPEKNAACQCSTAVEVAYLRVSSSAFCHHRPAGTAFSKDSDARTADRRSWRNTLSVYVSSAFNLTFPADWPVSTSGPGLLNCTN